MDGDSQHYAGGSDQKHPKEKEMHEDKVNVWEGFTNSWEKQRSKRQGEREKYNQLNAEFQKITGRYKKAFLNEQCKEVGGNIRLGKVSWRKLEIQGNISCKDGHHKGQIWLGPNRSRGG